MSQIQLEPCIHNGTIPIQYEHKGIVSHKLSCQDCIDFIKSSSTYTIIDKTPLKNLEHF